jgi:hypothetical protein
MQFPCSRRLGHKSCRPISRFSIAYTVATMTRLILSVMLAVVLVSYSTGGTGRRDGVAQQRLSYESAQAPRDDSYLARSVQSLLEAVGIETASANGSRERWALVSHHTARVMHTDTGDAERVARLLQQTSPSPPLRAHEARSSVRDHWLLLPVTLIALGVMILRRISMP